MKLQEYKQLVVSKLGIMQDTVKQQWGLIRWMIDNNMNDPNHGITIQTLSGIFSRCRAWFHGGVAPRYKPLDGWMMEQPATSADLRILMSSLRTAERCVLIVWTSDSGRWWR